VISILTLFIVIAASRPVNKNVSTGAVIRAKQTGRAIKPVVTSLGLCAAGTEESYHSLSFMNTLTKSTQAVKLDD